MDFEIKSRKGRLLIPNDVAALVQNEIGGAGRRRRNGTDQSQKHVIAAWAVVMPGDLHRRRKWRHPLSRKDISLEQKEEKSGNETIHRRKSKQKEKGTGKKIPQCLGDSFPDATKRGGWILLFGNTHEGMRYLSAWLFVFPLSRNSGVSACACEH